MRVVDPITQCEKTTYNRGLISTLMMFSLFSDIGFPQPKYIKGRPEWYYQSISKEDRKLPYLDQVEVRRYKWTLKQMYYRDRQYNS